MMEPALGLRVVRGPDWEWGDQDGGEGYVGTVVGLEEGGGEVIVQWDMGQKCRYRCGRDHKYDLRVLDSGPTGHKFCKYPCHVCQKKVCGVMWRCLHCPEYYLCSICYLANYHCSLHQFTCLLDRYGKQYRVPARVESRCAPVRGLFPGAVVERGVDWKWKDQDGGRGRRGKVEELSGWGSGSSSRSERSVVTVVWANRNKNKYRAGHTGKVDLRCISPGDGGYYYPEHLPVLGQEVKQSTLLEHIVTGDRVKCEVEPSLFENPGMADKIGLMLDHVGVVSSILSNGELMVRFPGNTLVQINPSIAKKVDVPVFEVGDVVRMISDMAEVYRLQKGHGEWSDDMALCLDQVGRVTKVVGGTTVTVTISSYRWILNPRCVRHAPNEDPPPQVNLDAGISLLRSEGLSLLLDSIGPGILIHATAKGDITTVRAFLERNPHQVNILEQGKTAVHVAVEETKLSVLELILNFKPDLSTMDSDGDTVLHSCAFHNSLEATSMLLKAGADINARNLKRGITPVMIAGAVGNIKLMEMMVTHPTAKVNVQDDQGQTALHHIISSQRTRAIPILLSAGSSLDLLNSNLFNPLMEAATHGSLPAVEDIVRKSPGIIHQKRPSDSITPLQLAGVRDHLFIVRHLALCGCDMNAKSDTLRTALHTSIIEGNSAVVELLVGFGVDVNIRDSDGNTALHIVFVNKNSHPLSDDMNPQMNKVRDELNRLPMQGTIPLYLIVGCFLVQEGGDPSVRNHGGRTPAQSCPNDKRDILLNYINKSSRGEFHGSLRRDKATTAPAITSTAESAHKHVQTRGLVTLSHSDTNHSTLPLSVERSTGAGAHEAEVSGSQQSTSIMEAQHQPVSGVGGSHRERDRLKLQAEAKKKETKQGESEGPPSLSAEELRKRREAYFTLQAAKRKPPTTTESASVSETSKTCDTKRLERARETQPMVQNPTQTEKELDSVKADDNLQPLPERLTHKQSSLLRKSAGKHEENSEGEVKQKPNGNSEQFQRKIGRGEKKQNLSHRRDTTTSEQIHPKDGANVSVLCFICESPADASFTPCGHKVACKKCANRAKRCPICKVLVTGALSS